MRLARIGVDYAQLAAGHSTAAILDHAAAVHAADHRAVRLAVDGDVDLMRRAVGTVHGDGVDQRFAVFQRLHIGAAAVELVDPVAVDIDAEGTVSRVVVSHRLHGRLTLVGVLHLDETRDLLAVVFLHMRRVVEHRGHGRHDGAALHRAAAAGRLSVRVQHDSRVEGPTETGHILVEARHLVGVAEVMREDIDRHAGGVHQHHVVALPLVVPVPQVHQRHRRHAPCGVVNAGQAAVGRAQRHAGVGEGHFGRDVTARVGVAQQHLCHELELAVLAGHQLHADDGIDIGRAHLRRLGLRHKGSRIVLPLDGYGDGVRSAIGAVRGEGVGQRFAGLELLDGGVLVVGFIQPIAVRIESEVPVTGLHRILLLELQGPGIAIGVIDLQLPGDMQIAEAIDILVFRHRPLVDTGDDGCVVLAGEGDGQVPYRASAHVVGHGDRDGQRLGLALGQMLVGRVGRVEAVAAVGLQGETGHRLVDAEAQGVARIRVAGVHLAAELRTVFTHRLALREQHRGVVLAVDRYRDDMAAAIGTGHHEAVGQLSAGLQVLHRRLAVVHAVDPVAAGVDAEAAVGPGHILLRIEVVLAGIRVADAELAAGLQLAGVIDADVGDRDGQRVADIGHGRRRAQGGGQAVDGHTAQGVVVHVVASIASKGQLHRVTAVVQIEAAGGARLPVQQQLGTRMAFQQAHHLAEADVVTEHALVAATGQHMTIRIYHVRVAAVEAENHVAQAARIPCVDRVADLFERGPVALERADDAGQDVMPGLVRPLNVDADGVGRAVDTVYGEALGGALSGVQGLYCGAAVIGLVDPAATCTQAKLAELAGQVLQRRELVAAGIRRAGMQLAVGDELAAADVLVLGQGLVVLTGDDRRIVLAGDADIDGVHRAVGAAHGEAVGDALAVAQGLHLGLAVVALVVPLAVFIKAELPIAARRAALRNEVGLAIVGIGHRELAAQCIGPVFLRGAGLDPAKGGSVVGAPKKDRQGLRCASPRTVGHGDGDAQRLALAGGQVLVSGIARVKAVAAIGVQREAVHRVPQAEGQGVAHIDIAGVELAAQGGAAFGGGQQAAVTGCTGAGTTTGTGLPGVERRPDHDLVDVEAGLALRPGNVVRVAGIVEAEVQLGRALGAEHAELVAGALLLPVHQSLQLELLPGREDLGRLPVRPDQGQAAQVHSDTGVGIGADRGLALQDLLNVQVLRDPAAADVVDDQWQDIARFHLGVVVRRHLQMELRRVVAAGQRHRHGVQGAIGPLHGEGVVQGGAGGQLLDRLLAVVGAVAPVALGVQAEAAEAITAEHIGLRDEVAFAAVGVGYCQLARGLQLTGLDGLVLGHRAGEGTADHSAVIDAGDGDSQVLRVAGPGAVGDGDRDHQILGLASSEVLVGGIARIEAVAAVGVERKAIYRIGETEGECVTGIHIGGHHLPGEFGAIFADRLALRREHWRIVAASEGHCDGMVSAIGAGNGEAVGEGFARLELLNGTLAVIGAVAPLTVGVEAERAVTARHIGLCGEMVLACIRVADCELSMGFELACRQVGVFSDGAAIDPRNHGAVIMAVDGDGHCVGRAAHRLDGDTVGEGFARLELLDSGLAVVGAVVPLAVGVEAERAVTARHIGLCGEMVLACIRVADCELSMGFELACRQVGVFSDGAAVHSRNHCAIIMAVDGNGDLVSGAVDRLNSEAVGQCAGL